MSEFFALLQIVGCYQVCGAPSLSAGGMLVHAQLLPPYTIWFGECKQQLRRQGGGLPLVLSCGMSSRNQCTHPADLACFVLFCFVLTPVQIYCRPTYEVAEDYLMDQSKSPMSLRNVLARFAVTTTYCAILTLIGCAMPFCGAFLALVS
jgi:hypothetical protein